MRSTLVTILLLASVCFIYFADQPEHYAQVKKYISETIHHISYDKVVSIEGQKILSEEEVNKMLPMSETVLYWILNAPVISTQLRQSPLIQSADVQRCAFYTWSCFRVIVEERAPAFFAVVGSKGWVVGKDGGLIKPLAADKLSTYMQGGGVDENASRFVALAAQLKIPVIAGLLAQDASPDLIKARFTHLRKAMDAIEGELGIPISYLELGGGQQIKVRFFEKPFLAIFDVPPADIWDDQARQLVDRTKRLKKLLEEFGDKQDKIATVDLGFEKLAVVTTR